MSDEIRPQDRVVRLGSDGSRVGVVESVYRARRPDRQMAVVRWRRDENPAPVVAATLAVVHRPRP